MSNEEEIKAQTGDNEAKTEETPESSEKVEIEKEEKAKEPEKKPEPEAKEDKEKPEEKKAEVKVEAAKVSKSSETKQKKKINHLTLKEVNIKLEKIKEQMGGVNSDHAKQLLERKEVLEK